MCSCTCCASEMWLARGPRARRTGAGSIRGRDAQGFIATRGEGWWVPEATCGIVLPKRRVLADRKSVV